ncbi:MAG: cryptochrome/photolyase family protein [Acidimicrobiales bacterium]
MPPPARRSRPGGVSILVFGDQLNRRLGALGGADPDVTTVLLVESEALLALGRHVQRNHLVITAMRRFARELAAEGFDVDLRRAPTLRAGIEAHRAERRPERLRATEPNSRRARALCRALGIEQVRSDQFLCHHDDFARWAGSRKSLRMEDFYRWTRTRLGYLMDGDGPVGGRWNLDAENREPPPADLSVFAPPPADPLDDLDAEVLASLPPGLPGAVPAGWWATTRAGALDRLDHFVTHNLERFGPHEDAMTSGSWHLAHSVLSPYLNLGLLLPGEVCDAVEGRYRAGGVPLSSAEGFIRQVIGWREYVWGLYWLWPDHADANALDHHRPLPPMYTGGATTRMACLADTFDGLHQRAWVHHIPRLMLLSSFANLVGAEPRAVLRWMSDTYIDAAEWVMVPNVMGMALWADGGRMATKPYVSGGAYVNRMSDHCSRCPYDPRKRTGPDACPFTALYWDFLARHRERLGSSNRMARPLANLNRLSDLPEVRAEAARMVDAAAAGCL